MPQQALHDKALQINARRMELDKCSPHLAERTCRAPHHQGSLDGTPLPGICSTQAGSHHVRQARRLHAGELRHSLGEVEQHLYDALICSRDASSSTFKSS